MNKDFCIGRYILIGILVPAVALLFSNIVIAQAQIQPRTLTLSPTGGDMQSAIQNALNTVGSGGTVKLTAGIFNHSAQLNVPANVTFAGAGISSVLIGTTSNYVVLLSNGSSLKNMSIQQEHPVLNLSSMSDALAVAGAAAVNAKNYTMSGLNISNTTADAILLKNATGTVSNCNVASHVNGRGMMLENSGGYLLNNSISSGLLALLQVSNYGLNTPLIVSGNKIKNGSFVYVIGGKGFQLVNNNILVDECIFEFCTSSIFNGNNISGPVLILACPGNTKVNGNRFNNELELEDLSGPVQITNNTFANIPSEAGHPIDACAVQVCKNVSFTGNTVSNVSGAALSVLEGSGFLNIGSKNSGPIKNNSNINNALSNVWTGSPASMGIQHPAVIEVDSSNYTASFTDNNYAGPVNHLRYFIYDAGKGSVTESGNSTNTILKSVY